MADKVTITGAQVLIDPLLDFSSDTNYYVLMDANIVEDIDGNGFSGITDQTFWNFTTLDNIAPTVTITSTVGDTVTGNFTVTITFNELVTGFTQDDISVSNATIESFTIVTSGKVWDVVLAPIDDGTVTVDIASAVAEDDAGNDNTAATQFSVIYDSGVGIYDVEPYTLNIFSDADEVVIKFINNNYQFGNGHVEVYNVIGQKIIEEQITDFKEFRAKVDHSSEIYIVKVTIDGETKTEQVFIK